jgi:hypothetical protein
MADMIAQVMVLNLIMAVVLQYNLLEVLTVISTVGARRIKQKGKPTDLDTRLSRCRGDLINIFDYSDA